MKHRKRFGIAVLLLLLVVYLWPTSLGSKVPADTSLVITWTELGIIPPAEGETQSTLHNASTTYRLEAGTEEREAFQDLLDGYTIHRTWRTPIPANGLNGHGNGGYLLISWTEDQQYIHQVTTGFDYLILIDEHIYGLGYLDKFISLDMKERMLAFLGHCSPCNES